MKAKLVIIATFVFFVCSINGYAQDQNIEHLQVKINTVDTYLCDTLDGFKGPDHQLLRAYQWGNENSVSKAIYANQNSIKVEYLFKQVTFPPNPITYVADETQAHENAYLLISDPRFWTGTLKNVSLMHSHSMTYEPTLHITNIDTTQRQILDKRPNDPTRPIFGFTQIDNLARIPMDSNNPDSSFLKITNLALIDELVFSEPWGSEFLRKVM